jgi:hypothetical protein
MVEANGSNGLNGGNGNGNGTLTGTDRVKQGLAQMLKGGVIVSQLTPSYRQPFVESDSSSLRFAPIPPTDGRYEC